MRFPFNSLMLAAVIAAAPAALADAQAPGAHDQHAQASGLASDLLIDVGQVERKLLALARAIPEEKFGWRPGEGVRSVSEVVMHVASDNYLIPAALGFPADPATGIKGEDYKTALAFEKRTVTKAQAIAELEKSFAFLRQSLGATGPDRLTSSVTMFGQPFTMQQGWIMATTHLHEHLGQMIAYARSNNIKPPWG
jgi:uncharacterized damage-inducible protein DinB